MLTAPRLAHLTPNWFAVVMGTGIIAVATSSLPVNLPGRRGIALTFWLLAVTMLAVLVTAFAVHWIRHTEHAREYARSSTMFPFYGALPMAVLTVGAGTAAVGSTVIPAGLAFGIAGTLWALGTIGGLATSAVMAGRLRAVADRGTAVPAWLMPVVPPMVSAATGAALVTHLPEGGPRVAMLAGCYALFTLALVFALFIVALLAAEFRDGGLPPLQALPTMWIPLGIVGQSIAAANNLGTVAGHAVGHDTANALHLFGLGYGLLMGTVMIVVLAAVGVLTARAFRSGLTFTMSWWSFIFPVGACAVGMGAFGVAGDFEIPRLLSAGLLCALVLAWCVVAVHTAHRVRTRALPAPA
ncbi:TDT family transporter [Prescottella equi]|uniref:TDT family transporter n=1 Tax=Rhodococcus hoagii TaxID=43767 RepID=UPI0019D982AA|nr:TDT family transporter [Prescottella equi]NKR52718.1 C4-dicarboxylate ABC transporter [Prescottella equi]BCN45273.1 C4-dicarboxylate ABC transporter [Prescottella equi]